MRTTFNYKIRSQLLSTTKSAVNCISTVQRFILYNVLNILSNHYSIKYKYSNPFTVGALTRQSTVTQLLWNFNGDIQKVERSIHFYRVTLISMQFEHFLHFKFSRTQVCKLNLKHSILNLTPQVNTHDLIKTCQFHLAIFVYYNVIVCRYFIQCKQRYTYLPLTPINYFLAISNISMQFCLLETIASIAVHVSWRVLPTYQKGKILASLFNLFWFRLH